MPAKKPAPKKKQVNPVKSTYPKPGLGDAPKIRRNSHQKGMTAEAWTKANEEVKGDSSNVKKIRYNIHQKKMWVQFKDGSWYSCPGFPKKLAVEYFNATSLGKFHWWLRSKGWVFKKS